MIHTVMTANRRNTRGGSQPHKALPTLQKKLNGVGEVDAQSPRTF